MVKHAGKRSMRFKGSPWASTRRPDARMPSKPPWEVLLCNPSGRSNRTRTGVACLSHWPSALASAMVSVVGSGRSTPWRSGTGRRSHQLDPRFQHQRVLQEDRPEVPAVVCPDPRIRNGGEGRTPLCCNGFLARCALREIHLWGEENSLGKSTARCPATRPPVSFDVAKEDLTGLSGRPSWRT